MSCGVKKWGGTIESESTDAILMKPLKTILQRQYAAVIT